MNICEIQEVKNIRIQDVTKSTFIVDIDFIVKIEDKLFEDYFDLVTGKYSFNQEEDKVEIVTIHHQDEFDHYWENQISLESVFNELSESLTQFIKRNKDFIN